MSIIWKDGFDLYRNSSDLSLAYNSANNTLSTNSGRFGGGAVNIGTSTGYWFGKVISSWNVSEVIVGASFNINGTTTASRVFTFDDDIGTSLCIQYRLDTGVISAYKGNAATLLASASVAPLNNGYNFIECHYKMHGSTGIVEIRINNNVVLTYTGNTKANGSATKITACHWATKGGFNSADALSCYVDDVYIVNPNDGTGLVTYSGDMRIQTLVPTSDASPNNGTPSTGSNHWACVDEARIDTSDYLTLTNTSGQAENFGFQSLSGLPITVFAVGVLAFALKDDAGACQVKNRLTAGSTTATGADTALLTSGTMISDIWEINPDTSASFTISDVNALKAGMRIT